MSLPDLLISRLGRFREQLGHLPRALRLVWQAAGWWLLVWGLVLLLQGLAPAGLLYLTRWLVDALVASLTLATGTFEVWLAAGLVAATILTMELLRSVAGLVRTIQSERLHDHVADLVHRQSIRLDLAFYDWPEYHDHLHRARAESSSRPLALLDSLGGLLQHGTTLLGLGVILLPYGWWLALLMVASTLPVLAVVLQYSYQQHHWHRQRTPHERRCWYLDWLLTSSETAAELRLFQWGDRFRHDYQRIRAELRLGNIRLGRRQAAAELGAGLFAMGLTGGVMVWMLWRVQRGASSLGDLVLFYQAFRQGQQMMHSFLHQAGQLYYNTLFLGNLYEFLDLQSGLTAISARDSVPNCVGLSNFAPVVSAYDKVVKADALLSRSERRQSLQHADRLPALDELSGTAGQGSDGGLVCRAVGFRYPGSARDALHGFHLHVPTGQFAAIVGPNGAGKSTLVKLLCRLYDPQQGEILWNGIDLRQLDPVAYRQLTSVLFQQPVHYSATVAENLALGSFDAHPEQDDLHQAAAAAGADTFIHRLPGGYHQMLGKWFEGGTELSVGQWQRLALARAYLRQSPILILDEPTSAMDPWAESDWLRRFRELARDRTSILITHRLTTAMHADVIHVLSEGRIVESGNHQQLLAREGLYARSWKRQMLQDEPAGELEGS